MPMGLVPGFRRLTKKETRELFKLPWVRDEELSDKVDEARVLPDGRVLYCSATAGDNQAAVLYPSREALAQVQRKGREEAAKPRVLPITILLPAIDDFLRDVEAHAKSLGLRLHVPDEVLDGTPESLGAVDKALKRIPWAKRQVPDLVTPLVAYVGEVMRRASGGRWTKPPSIVTSNGRSLDPFALVFVPMVEPSKRLPLRAAVETTLIVNGYRPAPEPAA
jgi:hypothetical protein